MLFGINDILSAWDHISGTVFAISNTPSKGKSTVDYSFITPTIIGTALNLWHMLVMWPHYSLISNSPRRIPWLTRRRIEKDNSRRSSDSMESWVMKNVHTWYVSIYSYNYNHRVSNHHVEEKSYLIRVEAYFEIKSLMLPSVAFAHILKLLDWSRYLVYAKLLSAGKSSYIITIHLSICHDDDDLWVMNTNEVDGYEYECNRYDLQEKNLAIIHCPPGHPSTGILIACLLKYIGAFSRSEDAYDFYCTKR